MSSGTSSRQLGERLNLLKYWGLAVALMVMFADVWAESGAWTQKASMPESGGTASVVNGKIYMIGGAGAGPSYPDLKHNLVYDPSTDTWETKKSLPSARGFLTSAVVHDTIYVIGGGYPTATGVVEAYDPASDTWTSKASMPAPRIGMASAVVNGIIYIMGGNYDQRDCQAYNPRTNSWSVKSPIPVGGGGWVASAIAYNDIIYVFGGSTYSPWTPLKTVFAYDPRTDQWTQKKDMPTARFAVGTYLVDGRIYVLGGSQGSNNTLATVEVYDPLNDTWNILTPTASMPMSLFAFGNATVNGRIYVLGGSQDWSIVKTDVWEYDPFFGKDGAWTKKASMPEAGGTASVVKGKIYMTGGAGAAPDYPDMAHNLVYDPSTNTWETKKPLPTARGFLTSAVVNDTIYVIGGGYPAGRDVVEAYDPATDTWTTKAKMLQPRIGMGAAVVDGIIYIMGGNYNERNCQAYNPKTNAWSEKSPIPVGGGGWVHSATAYNGMIYVFGGSTYSPWAPLKTVFAYDPKTDQWTQKKNMPTARFAVGTYLVDGRIYVLGGSQGQSNTLATVEVYDPVFDTWTSLAPSMPWSLFSFGFATVNGRIYVLGGTHDWSTGQKDVWEYDPLGPWLAVGVEEQRQVLPFEFVLAQNYPNPFNPSTTIAYELPRSATVRLTVFDVLGREIAVLVNERKEAGTYRVSFDASRVSSGVYVYRMEAGGFGQSRRMIVVR